MRLAIIVPVLNRASSIERSLQALAPLRRHGHRVIVVDGGSRDDSAARARDLADRVILAPRGWSYQANAGSRVAEAEHADVLVFLPDTVRLPADADRAILRAIANSRSPWGRFDIHYACAQGARGSWWLASRLANACARLTGICTREQALFVARSAFLALDGFSTQDRAADMEFCERARLLGAPIVLPQPVQVPAPSAGALRLARAMLRRETERLCRAAGFPLAAPDEYFRAWL